MIWTAQVATASGAGASGMKPPDPRYNINQKIEATGGSTIENVTQQVTIERAKLDRVFLAPPLPPHFVKFRCQRGIENARNGGRRP